MRFRGESSKNPAAIPALWLPNAGLISKQFISLGQALIELIANAAESGSDEIIEIRVQIDQLDDRLLIMVKDHGCGMSQKTLEHAFDPFYSEKPAGRQTGLGLCRARRVVEIMGGTVSISSKESIGTRVLVTLPRWRVIEKERDASKAA